MVWGPVRYLLPALGKKGLCIRLDRVYHVSKREAVHRSGNYLGAGCADGARIGYVVTATGRGVDGLDSVRTLLVQVQTYHTISISLTLFEGSGKFII